MVRPARRDRRPHPDRTTAPATVIDGRTTTGVPTSLSGLVTLVRAARRAGENVAYLECSRTSNGPTEAVQTAGSSTSAAPLGRRNLHQLHHQVNARHWKVQTPASLSSALRRYGCDRPLPRRRRGAATTSPDRTAPAISPIAAAVHSGCACRSVLT